MKTQKKIDKYHKNQEIPNLVKDITHNIQTIERSVVNFTENAKPIIIQIKNTIKIEILRHSGKLLVIVLDTRIDSESFKCQDSLFKSK
ncbi:MAG: hypothetical protein LBQ59_00355 [Candidatus Peribacteria bacterium]|nr:hypothetical protein [Candidatus Peribacteria bacterium]